MNDHQPGGTGTREAIMRGLRQKCVRCGEGKVFASYLKPHDSCPVCGQDFTKGNIGDGPAFFVSFGALILFAPFFFLIPMIDMPIWGKVLGMVIAVGAMTVFCLALLPVVKSLLLALQIHHRAEEARLED